VFAFFAVFVRFFYIVFRYITSIGVIVGSIFWSSLVNSVNAVSEIFPFPKSQQQTLSAVIMLIFLVLLPFVFDTVARYYEGYKLESEIQNSIMTRYFYYQLINVYVTVGFSGSSLWYQLYQMLSKCFVTVFSFFFIFFLSIFFVAAS
jgi:hypothetical protein